VEDFCSFDKTKFKIDVKSFSSFHEERLVASRGTLVFRGRPVKKRCRKASVTSDDFTRHQPTDII